jgi:hypothetical protein
MQFCPPEHICLFGYVLERVCLNRLDTATTVAGCAGPSQELVMRARVNERIVLLHIRSDVLRH